MPACCLLRLISSWVHLSRSLAGLSTLPDQKLSWHAQRNSTHMSRWLRPSRSRIRRISLAHPANSVFWLMARWSSPCQTSTLRRSGLLLSPTCCRSELQHPVSPQEDRFLVGQRIRQNSRTKKVLYCLLLVCLLCLPDLGKLFLPDSGKFTSFR